MKEGINFQMFSAGNTDYLALITLMGKGYDVQEAGSDVDLGAQAWKNGRFFADSSWLQVLGLVTLWDLRGDDWALRDGEPDPDDVLSNLHTDES